MSKLAIIIAILSILVVNMDATSRVLHKRRFDQNSPPILQEISDLDKIAKLGTGQFAGINGAFHSVLLAGTPACTRYTVIDELVKVCKANNVTQGIDLAKKLAALEKNYNPFSGDKAKPSFCDDPSLPASPEVRCVVPVIDPAFPGAAEFNAKAKSRLEQIRSSPDGNPGLCAGQSVQQQAIALGISGCIGCNIAPGSNAGGDKTAGTDLSSPTGSVPQDQTPPPLNNVPLPTVGVPQARNSPPSNDVSLPTGGVPQAQTRPRVNNGLALPTGGVPQAQTLPVANNDLALPTGGAPEAQSPPPLSTDATTNTPVTSGNSPAVDGAQCVSSLDFADVFAKGGSSDVLPIINGLIKQIETFQTALRKKNK